MLAYRFIIGFIFFISSSTYSFALHSSPEKEAVDSPASSIFLPAEEAFVFHEDSIHQLDLHYAGQQKGLKPWIAPAILVASGTATHFMTGMNEDVQGFMQDNLTYAGSLDDYTQYAPLATVYLLNLAGIKGKNNFGNRSAIALKSILVSNFITYRLKVWVNDTRPDGGIHSFPSGHTSTAFTFAQFMHREYGDRNAWYSIGAYSVATAVGIMRMAKNAHWVSDVLLGAGIGMLSTELIYLTHQYKWDNEHLRRFDIFPFQFENKQGISLVYTF